MTRRPERLPASLRIVRGVLLAACAFALTVTAHSAGGGDLPGSALTVFLTLLVAAAGTAFADRKRSAGAIVLALGAAQLFMHLLLTTAGTHHLAEGTSDTARMLLAHTVAGVLLGALLARADECVLMFVSVARRVLPKLPPLLVVPDARVPRPVVPEVVGLQHGIVLATCASRRGPPPSR
ncbi:hypothetical protein [Lentzea sp. CA-135723]|uniref:hypothetical protein n=1 Tax=Lentzea sp. CA-135723 TaxID=3239950 RepID=UPI003D941BFB